MPKMKFRDSKGLVQETGSGVDISSSTTVKIKGNSVTLDGSALGGHYATQQNISPDESGFSGAACMLSASHAGKTLLLGDSSADYTIHIPAVAGWKARFTLTGSQGSVALSNDVFLTASAGFSALATATPFKGMVLQNSDASISGDITFTSAASNANTGVKFVASSGVQCGDFVDVEVVTTSTTPTILVTGTAQD